MSRPRFWTYNLYPYKSYRMIAENEWREYLYRSGYELEEWEERLLDLDLLLSGSVQPADFVKLYIKRWENARKEPRVPRPYSSRGEYSSEYRGYETGYEGEVGPSATFATSDEARRRSLFYLALKKADIFLHAMYRAMSNANSWNNLNLLLANLLAISTLILFSFVFPVMMITSLDDLTFASLFLITPTISLFYYSRLLHTFHLHEEDIQGKQTRLSSAAHAYETYEEIERIQRRLLEAEEERHIEEKFEEERRITNETRTNEMLMEVLRKRAQTVAEARQILEIDRFSEEAQLRLIEMLLQFHNPSN